MAVTQLIYVSTMVGEAEQELKAILESAVRHNQRNGITGMLLYHKGVLMQVLEGSEAAVTDTYARICQDNRHHNITGLTVAEVPHRRFDNWSMGFKHISASEIAQFPQLAPIFDSNTQANAFRANPALAMEMLTLFSSGTVWRVPAPASTPGSGSAP
jgi:hypothetical protein